MANLHSRNPSAADRRSINNEGGVSRAASQRAKDYEKPSVRGDGSPIPSENFSNGSYAENPYEKSNKHISDFERRTERTYTTTKEKITRTRSPVKESANAGNRGEPDRARRSLQSPVPRKKQKEAGQGRL
jgi:gamma-tubulin complex component 2